LSSADTSFRSLLPEGEKTHYLTLDVHRENEGTWSYDTVEEFFAAADQGFSDYLATNIKANFRLSVRTDTFGNAVSVMAPNRDQIEEIFSVFESNLERCRRPDLRWSGEKESGENKVFVGHGANPQWRDLKDHLHEKHGYAIEAYEIGARAGHTICGRLKPHFSKKL